MIAVGNVFQYADGQETIHQGILGVDHGTSTGRQTPGAQDIGTSNINGGVDDFNLTLPGTDLSLQFPEANNFQPDFGSVIIDSSVNSLIERDSIVAVKASVGLPVSNILAPTHDVGGVLRADNPDFSPPGGIGGSVFKDRGSTELADFNGPVAIAELPRDNVIELSISGYGLNGVQFNSEFIRKETSTDGQAPATLAGFDRVVDSIRRRDVRSR